MTTSSNQLLYLTLLMLISCRYINTKTVEPTPSELVPVNPLPAVMINVTLKGQNHLFKRTELINPVNLSLECTWSDNQNKPLNITAYWAKDGLTIQDSHLAVTEENEQYKLKGAFSIISEENLGNYTCVFGNEAKVDFILAAPEIAEKHDKPIVTYVGDSVTLVCKMDDSKPRPTTWNWFKENGTEKEQIFPAAEPHHYEIHNSERKTRLKVINVMEADSGVYYCSAVYPIGTPTNHIKLKVITFMEPLKPFISIMAEVIILVTAILLYERSQSKKNNREEDATNADQNNSLQQEDDNGEEETSSMRQRKVESP